VLAGYCQAYGRGVEAERKLKETPALLKMPSGYIQQNPWLTISNKPLELMASMRLGVLRMNADKYLTRS
jgi:hypothetical protein